MAHPRGEVLSFPPLRFVRGEYPAADLDRLVTLYRPLLPRPAGIANVALMGPLLYRTTGKFKLDATKEVGAMGAGENRGPDNVPYGPNHLEVLELYQGRQRPQHRHYCGRRYSIGLWAVGTHWLERSLSRPDQIDLITQRLALLAAPVLKDGRKKRNFHRLQMVHRARLLGHGARHLLPSRFTHMTPSGGAMLLLDTLLFHDPAMAPLIAYAFINCPQSQRNRNALYRRVNWLMEKYPNYRRAGYKGGEPAYRLLDHFNQPYWDGGRSRRLLTCLSHLRASLPMFLGGGCGPAVSSMMERLPILLHPPPLCLHLFKYRDPLYDGYAAIGPSR